MSDIPIIYEILAGGSAVLGGFFGLVRYIITTNTKREGTILDHHERQQTQMMEFYEKKNGHLERISKDFAESHKEVGKVMGALITEIKVLASKHAN